MSFIAFPLRLQGGSLKRCGEPEAIVALIGAMARTPHGSWKASPHFGLRDWLGDVRRTASVQNVLAEINLALQYLGITHYRADALVREQGKPSGVDTYELTLVPTEGGQGVTVPLRA